MIVGFTSIIKDIHTIHGTLDEAFAPMSITMTLNDDIDISRGDMIVRENNQPTVGQDIDLMVCWLNEKPLAQGAKYAIKHTTNDARCIIKEVRYKLDINTLHRNEGDNKIGVNDIARIKIRTTKPLLYDRYERNRETGSLILIDEGSNETVGAAMII